MIDPTLKELNRKLKRKEYQKEYKALNKDKIKKQRKEYNKLNEDKIKEYQKEHNKKYNILNKDRIKEQQREYRKLNKNKRKKYYEEHKDKIADYQKEYQIEYRKLNEYKLKEQKKEYDKHKLETDPFYRFKKNIRRLIALSIKNRGFSKKSRTFKIIGCSFEEAVSHFQSKFTDGMTLANHGLWHIDHIIPMSTAKTYEEAIKLNHISNLQPLWADDNFKKSDTLDWTKNDKNGL